VQRQGIGDEIGLAWRGEALQPVEKAQPGGRVTGSGSREVDGASPLRERAKRPAIALTRITGREVRAMRLLAPPRTRIALGRWRGVERDDGPLFSAKSGSSLSSQVRVFCYLMCSAWRIRRIWLRLMEMPCCARTCCSRSRVQWRVGGIAPSAGLGGSPHAKAMTWL
jgi:hypothetical protein